MLPGDSVNQLAALFYPGNKRMQTRFVAQTLQLNRELNPSLKPASIIGEPRTLIIPDLKTLSRQAGPFKSPNRRINKAASKLRTHRQPEQAATSEITPELQAAYEDLRTRDVASKLQLEQIDRRLADLQATVQQMKSAESVIAQQSLPASAKAIAPSVVSTAKIIRPDGPAQRISSVVSTPAESSWRQLLVAGLILLLAVIAVVAARAWLRRQMAKNTQDKIDQHVKDIRKHVFHQMQAALPNTPAVMNSVTPNVLSIEEIKSVMEEAKIFVSMGRIYKAKALLTRYIEELPKAALAPWLFLMDIYRGLNQKNEFVALAKRFHETFNAMTPQWETKGRRATDDSLERFGHIVSKLEIAWRAGETRNFLENLLGDILDDERIGFTEAKKYLETLLNDNRDGERTGFSLEVLQEITLLLEVLEIRDESREPSLNPSA